MTIDVKDRLLNGKVIENISRAFWRRIEPYKARYGKDLPPELPVEFMAHMTTALNHVKFDTPTTGLKIITEEAYNAFGSRIKQLELCLEGLIHGYVVTLENARDRIVFHGGECDSVETMERNDPLLNEAKWLLKESAAAITTATQEASDGR